MTCNVWPSTFYLLIDSLLVTSLPLIVNLAFSFLFLTQRHSYLTLNYQLEKKTNRGSKQVHSLSSFKLWNQKFIGWTFIMEVIDCLHPVNEATFYEEKYQI